MKFFKNKNFLTKTSEINKTLVKSNDNNFNKNFEDKCISPKFLSLRKSHKSNDSMKQFSSNYQLEENENKHNCPISNRTPSFDLNQSKNSIDVCLSNPKSNESKKRVQELNNINSEKDTDEVFIKINKESQAEESLKTNPVKNIQQTVIYTYDNIDKKNSYGIEYSKLSNSIQSSHPTWYDSKKNSENIIYNPKLQIIFEKSENS